MIHCNNYPILLNISDSLCLSREGFAKVNENHIYPPRITHSKLGIWQEIISCLKPHSLNRPGNMGSKNQNRKREELTFQIRAQIFDLLVAHALRGIMWHIRFMPGKRMRTVADNFVDREAGILGNIIPQQVQR